MEALGRFVRQPEFQPHSSTAEEHGSMASKFTPERQQLIIEKLKQNPSLYSAAATAEITYPTLMRWLERGEDGDEGYAEFHREVEQGSVCFGLAEDGAVLNDLENRAEYPPNGSNGGYEGYGIC
jgi:hypothetical protein